MTRWLPILTIAMMGLFAGCNDEPQYMSEHKIDATEQSGLPPMFSDRPTFDDSYKAAAAAGPAPAQAQPAPGENAEVTIDDSTPEALANTFAALLNANQFGRLPEIFVPQQQEVMRQMFGLIQPISDAVSELERKAREAFPDHTEDFTSFERGGQTMSVGRFGIGEPVSVVNVEEVSPTEATATFDKGSAGEKQYTLRQVDGAWRISDPEAPDQANVQAGVAMMKAMFGHVAAAYEGAITRLDAGEFTTAEQLKAALTDAVLSQQ